MFDLKTKIFKLAFAALLAFAFAAMGHADVRRDCPTAAATGLCVLYNGPWSGAFANYLVSTPVGTAPALWVISFSTAGTINATLADTPDATVTSYTGNTAFWFSDVTCSAFGVNAGVGFCKGNQFTLAQEAVLVSGSGGSGNVELVLQFAPLTAPTLLALNNVWTGSNIFNNNITFNNPGVVLFNNGFSLGNLSTLNLAGGTLGFGSNGVSNGSFFWDGTEWLRNGVICLDISCNVFMGGGTHPDSIYSPSHTASINIGPVARAQENNCCGVPLNLFIAGGCTAGTDLSTGIGVSYVAGAGGEAMMAGDVTFTMGGGGGFVELSVYRNTTGIPGLAVGVGADVLLSRLSGSLSTAAGGSYIHGISFLDVGPLSVGTTYYYYLAIDCNVALTVSGSELQILGL